MAPARSVLVAAVLAPLLVLSLSAWHSWDRALQGAEVEVTRTVDAAAEYARRLLEGQLLRVRRTDDLLSGLTDAEISARQAPLHAALADLAAEREPAQHAAFYLFAFDHAGDPLVSSNVYPVIRSNPLITGRDYNLALRGPNAPWVHVSEIYTGVSTDRPYFAVAARRTRTGNPAGAGGYDGVINASAYIDQINPRLASLAAGPSDLVSLVRADGFLLARSSGFAGSPNGAHLMPDGPMMAALRRGSERGVLRFDLPTLDGERIIAYRQVGGEWPVYAMAGRSIESITRGWSRALLPQAVLAVGSSLLLLLLSRAVLRRQGALVTANMVLEDRVQARTRDLRDREQLLRLAQQAAGAGSWSWEPASQQVSWSDDLDRLFGFTTPQDRSLAGLAGFLDRVHPDDRGQMRRALARSLTRGRLETEFRVVRPLGGGASETAWLMCRAGLHAAKPDRPAGLVGIIMDVTRQRRAERRFASASAAMSGFVYEWEVATGRFDRSAGAVDLLGAAAPGERSAADWLRRVHPADRRLLLRQAALLRRDPTRNAYAVEYRVRHADGSWVWLWDRGRVTRDPASGMILGIQGGAVDITARRRAEERQVLLLREVDHRAKNALAVVKAALRLTPRQDPDAFAAAVEGRIDALARAQALLSETSWSGTPLNQVLHAALEPFQGGEEVARLVLEGEAGLVLEASAIQPLTMAVHELATNATKYGALSQAQGRVAVRWGLAGDRLRLVWEESGGPEVSAPERRGFGSRVVEATVRSQLGGSVTWHWASQGLRLAILLPRARVLRSRPADRSAA